MLWIIFIFFVTFFCIFQNFIMIMNYFYIKNKGNIILSSYTT